MTQGEHHYWRAAVPGLAESMIGEATGGGSRAATIETEDEFVNSYAAAAEELIAEAQVATGEALSARTVSYVRQRAGERDGARARLGLARRAGAGKERGDWRSELAELDGGSAIGSLGRTS